MWPEDQVSIDLQLHYTGLQLICKPLSPRKLDYTSIPNLATISPTDVQLPPGQRVATTPDLPDTQRLVHVAGFSTTRAVYFFADFGDWILGGNGLGMYRMLKLKLMVG